MGLDMHLTRKHYIGAEFDFRGVKGTVDITIRDKKIPINFNRISYIEERACYWRKANAIHKWFVDNVQEGNDDCKEYYVSTEKLEKLLDLCKQVKEKAIIKKGKVCMGYKFENGEKIPMYEDGEIVENGEELEELLPTESGFFFGSIGYDQWYMQDINYTIENLEKLLEEEKEMNKDGFYSDFYYQASW